MKTKVCSALLGKKLSLISAVWLVLGIFALSIQDYNTLPVTTWSAYAGIASFVVGIVLFVFAIFLEWLK